MPRSASEYAKSNDPNRKTHDVKEEGSLDRQSLPFYYGKMFTN